MDKETTLYEVGYLLISELKDEEISVFVDKLRDLLSDKGGLIVSEGSAKRLTLEYPIKKELTASFNWLRFVASPELIKDVKDFLDKESGVLRHLITKPLKEKAIKPIIKPKIKIEKISDSEKTETEKQKEPSEKPVKKEAVKEEEIDKRIEEILGE